MIRFLLATAIVLTIAPLAIAGDCDGDAGTALVVGQVLQSKIEENKCLIQIQFTYFKDHYFCPVTLNPESANWIEVTKDTCPATGSTTGGIVNAYNSGRWTLEDT